MEDERMLTVRQVAEKLQVNPETVRRWVRNGKLKAVSLGSDAAGYRIPASELERVFRSGLG